MSTGVCGGGMSLRRPGWQRTVLPAVPVGAQFLYPCTLREALPCPVSPVPLFASCPAGPLCPGAAMPLPSSSPLRRTPPWGQSSSMRWTPVASTTSTRRSSACFPRCGFGVGGLLGGGDDAGPQWPSVALPM